MRTEYEVSWCHDNLLCVASLHRYLVSLIKVVISRVPTSTEECQTQTHSITASPYTCPPTRSTFFPSIQEKHGMYSFACTAMVYAYCRAAVKHFYEYIRSQKLLVRCIHLSVHDFAMVRLQKKRGGGR